MLWRTSHAIRPTKQQQKHKKKARTDTLAPGPQHSHRPSTVDTSGGCLCVLVSSLPSARRTQHHRRANKTKRTRCVRSVHREPLTSMHWFSGACRLLITRLMEMNEEAPTRRRRTPPPCLGGGAPTSVRATCAEEQKKNRTGATVRGSGGGAAAGGERGSCKLGYDSCCSCFPRERERGTFGCHRRQAR